MAMNATCSCLCASIRDLAQYPDETRATNLAPDLNAHLKDLQTVLGQSRTISREVNFKITSSNDRVKKTLSLDAPDLAAIGRICDNGSQNPDWFWEFPDTNRDEDERSLHIALQRRLACIAIFLRSTIVVQAPIPLVIDKLFQGRCNYTEMRNAGRKYIKVAKRLGDLGSIFWLPTSIPYTTYERYIHYDDEEFFQRVETIRPMHCNYSDSVRCLLTQQLQESLPPLSYCNLSTEYAEVLPSSCLLLVLLYALGGSSIPSMVMERLHLLQRRWDAQGEIYYTSASEFGISAQFINILTDSDRLDEAFSSCEVAKQITDDNIPVWSLSKQTMETLDISLLPVTKDYIGNLALKIMCFVIPPCFEGNLDWPVSLKQLVWPVFKRTVTAYKISNQTLSQVVEALFYFAERDSVPIRHSAMNLAKSLIRRSTPYYLQAACVLFQSTLLRIDADFVGSESCIRDFTWKGPKPTSRRDHSLSGRLHISQMENRIKLYDSSVPSCIYDWEAQEPISSLEMEVTSRLQSTAARFFQSIGEFPAARASLDQFLSLDDTKPIRSNSRRLLVGRLADVCCEMQDYETALALLGHEIGRCEPDDQSRRWCRRLLLAQAEARIGLGQMDLARNILEGIRRLEPSTLSDIHDEQLHMRRLIASARVDHLRCKPHEAVLHWHSLLQEVDRMNTLTDFAKAVIYLSLAHAQLLAHDRDGARRSWTAGSEILQRDRCEFWLTTVPTFWLPFIAKEIHQLQGWSFRMKQPGGKPDIVWPLVC